jgi:hypothetical protein
LFSLIDRSLAVALGSSHWYLLILLAQGVAKGEFSRC